MGKKKKRLTDSLDDAIRMVNEEISGVVADLDLEKANLEELVPAAEEATQRQLAQLRGSIKGLQSRLNDLQEGLQEARKMAGELQSDDEAASEKNSPDEAVAMDARDAAVMRHDQPVSLGEILRSLLMANEPAQRERARGNDQPSPEE